jgi:hypothetical protein
MFGLLSMENRVLVRRNFKIKIVLFLGICILNMKKIYKTSIKPMQL